MWDRSGTKGQMKRTENRDQGIPNKEQRLFLEIFRVRFFFPFVDCASLKITTFLGDFQKQLSDVIAASKVFLSPKTE